MNSHATAAFWKQFEALPRDVKLAALKQYRLWREDPSHLSLQFKKLTARYWSARVTQDYRAVGVRDGNTIIWFFIGSHAQYDRLLRD